MIVDWLIYGLFTWGLAALLNATAFSRQPANKWMVWSLTVGMFFLSLVAMTALQFFRYQTISQDLGIQITPRSPLDVVGAFTFSWVFFALLRKSAKGQPPTDWEQPTPAVSRQANFLVAANTARGSAAPPTQRLHNAEDVRTTAHVPDAGSPPLSEDCWAAALAEFDSAARRPGLWAKAFSQADGNEAIAKAGYLRSRAVELEGEQALRAEALRREEQSKIAALQHQAAEAEARKREVDQVEAERAYAALAKGVCPNHRCMAIIPLNSQACPKCGAIFEDGATWKVMPWKQT